MKQARRDPFKSKIAKSKLARELGITHGAISQWDRVPVGRVLEVERITGIPRHELRPDIYPPADAPAQPASAA